MLKCKLYIENESNYSALIYIINRYSDIFSDVFDACEQRTCFSFSLLDTKELGKFVCDVVYNGKVMNHKTFWNNFFIEDVI